MSVEQAVPARMRALAQSLPALRAGLDLAAYEKAGLDPLQPVLGLGPPDAPVCFFGRDPGTRELQLRAPFVGDAGLLLRRGLPGVGADAGFEALLQAGAPYFWLNIVPYKPRGNDVWPAAVRHAFRPLVLACLLQAWRGRHVVTLGEHAFQWFAVGQPPAVRERFRQRWLRVLDPLAEPVAVVLASEGLTREFAVHPLPHPSPRNVKGRQAFPPLLAACLRRVPLPAAKGDKGVCATFCRRDPR